MRNGRYFREESVYLVSGVVVGKVKIKRLVAWREEFELEEDEDD